MGNFIYFILDSLLSVLVWVIILNALLSWLVAFDVINLRHPIARRVAIFLDAVSRPVLAPFRRFIPPIGGIDVTPIIAILLIQAAQRFLLPWIFGFVPVAFR